MPGFWEPPRPCPGLRLFYSQAMVAAHIFGIIRILGTMEGPMAYVETISSYNWNHMGPVMPGMFSLLFYDDDCDL